VCGGTLHGILRVAGVEGSVRTADDVHEVHGELYRGQPNANP
jgi:hypothetical protein